MVKFIDLIREEAPKERIEEYWINTLSKRKMQKGNYFYSNIILLFEHYPDICYRIINNLPKLGYWKDYFLILNANTIYPDIKSRHELLEIYITKLLLEQIIKDIDNHKNNKRISTLAKWLPRQNCSFNKDYKFIPRFSRMMFPSVNPKYAQVLYRKTIVELTATIQPSEIIICQKHEQINFNKFTSNAFENRYKIFLKDPEYKRQLKNHLIKKYSHFNIAQFINFILMKPKHDNFRLSCFRKSWKNKMYSFFKKLRLDKIYIDGYTVIIDLTSELQTSTLFYYAIGYAIILSEINKTNKIIINGKNPVELDFSNLQIDKKIQLIEDNLYSFVNINISDYLEKYKNIFIISTKNISIDDDNIIFWKLSNKCYHISDNNLLLSGCGIKIYNLIKNTGTNKCVENIISNNVSDIVNTIPDVANNIPNCKTNSLQSFFMIFIMVILVIFGYYFE
jgi:hypothetical protein